jgi:hypothetical protein
MVKDYVGQIIDAIKDMPLDEVGRLGWGGVGRAGVGWGGLGRRGAGWRGAAWRGAASHGGARELCAGPAHNSSATPTLNLQVCVKLGLCPPARPAASRRLLASAGAAAHAIHDALLGPAAPPSVWEAAAEKLRTRYGGSTVRSARGAGGPGAGAARVAEAFRERVERGRGGGGKREGCVNGLRDTMPCQLCNAAAEYAQQALHSNKTVEEIEEVGAWGGVAWGGVAWGGAAWGGVG